MKMILKGALGSAALSLLLPCVLLCTQAGCTASQPAAAELQRLQGTWEEVGQESGDTVTLEITGNTLHFERDATFWYEATFALPAGTDPQQLHATIQRSSPPEDSIGEVILAIFKLEDGTLTLAEFQADAAEPSQALSSSSDDLLFRYEFKKVMDSRR